MATGFIRNYVQFIIPFWLFHFIRKIGNNKYLRKNNSERRQNRYYYIKKLRFQVMFEFFSFESKPLLLVSCYDKQIKKLSYSGEVVFLIAPKRKHFPQISPFRAPPNVFPIAPKRKHVPQISPFHARLMLLALLRKK